MFAMVSEEDKNIDALYLEAKANQALGDKGSKDNLKKALVIYKKVLLGIPAHPNSAKSPYRNSKYS